MESGTNKCIWQCIWFIIFCYDLNLVHFPAVSPTTYQMYLSYQMIGMFLTKFRPLKLLCLCLNCSLCLECLFCLHFCLSPPHSSGLHFNITSSDKHSLDCSCMALLFLWGTTPPVHTSVTRFDMWYSNFSVHLPGALSCDSLQAWSIFCGQSCFSALAKSIQSVDSVCS